MQDRESFLEACDAIIAAAEKRRRQHKLWLVVNTLLAIAVLWAGFWHGASLLQSAAAWMHRSRPVSVAELYALRFFVTLCALCLVLLPIVRYRGGFKPEYSIHRLILQRLCEVMGGFELSARSVALEHMGRAVGLFPPVCGIREQCLLHGRQDKGYFMLSEVAVATEDGLSRGMVVLLKPGQSQHFAHLHQAGRELWLNDDLIDTEWLQKQGWKNLVRVESENMHGFSVMREAGQDEASLFPESDIDFLQKLSEAAQTPRLRQIGWDAKLWHRAAMLAGIMKMKLRSRKEKALLQAEQDYETGFSKVPPPYAWPKTGQEVSGKMRIFASPTQFMLFMPVYMPIFLPPSLFSASLDPVTGEILYDFFAWMTRFQDCANNSQRN